MKIMITYVAIKMARCIVPEALVSVLQGSLNKQDLKPIRFRDLRHSIATLMHKLNVATKVVSVALGHANVSTTLDIYSHVTPDMRSNVAEKIENSLLKRLI